MSIYIKKTRTIIKKLISLFFSKKVLLKLVNLIVDAKNEKGKFIQDYDLFLFDELTHLSKDNSYLKKYRASLDKAGNTDSDNVFKILRYYNLIYTLNDTFRREIDGAIAECGCWHGHSSFLIKEELDLNNIKKDFFIFDAFEDGFSDFKEQDLKGTSLKSKDIEDLNLEYSSNFELLKNKFHKNKNVKIRKGWIPEVLHNEQKRNYCFVHIDVDLFNPTYESLNYFFDKLTIGGCIVCDDYNYNLFPGAKIAVRKFLNTLDKNQYCFHPFAAGGCLIHKLF